MLSYQHAYHAGNMADVHKHGLLAWVLGYMVQKPKPLTYVETHAGRALYDLGGPEALKTGEAAAGIAVAGARVPPAHAYAKALAMAHGRGGADAYPGSPMVAAALLRREDRMVLAERHPQEVAVLRRAMAGVAPPVAVEAADGPEMVLRLAPPTPRRGLLLVDPSYEIKDEYTAMPKLLAAVHRKWPVGVLMLWYPILAAGLERPMVAALGALDLPKTALSEVRFPPAREGHGMVGSGLFVVNAPWGFEDAAAEVAGWIAP